MVEKLVVTLKVRRHRPREQKGAIDVHVDQIAPSLRLDLPEFDGIAQIVMPYMGHAKPRAIDQHLHATEGLQGGVHRAGAIVLTANVRRLRKQGGGLLRRCVQRHKARRAHIKGADACARLQQAQGHGLAQPTARACHDADGSFKRDG